MASDRLIEAYKIYAVKYNESTKLLHDANM